ncbi:hypothetical protein LENED_007113 [Lentinula edodes]|uniref:Uncharacterized protein n=1 Tax=Lentinula edodes TaxID=5353 RepID=A0A1Q3EDM8_LENED|nr:hypothetical protein LENED_007113 [Lentinula edodes]
METTGGMEINTTNSVSSDTEILKKRKRYIPKPPNPEILKRHGQSQRDTVEENWEEEERAEFEHDPEADNDEDEDDENDEADYEEDEATTNSRYAATISQKEALGYSRSISHPVSHPVSHSVSRNVSQAASHLPTRPPTRPPTCPPTRPPTRPPTHPVSLEINTTNSVSSDTEILKKRKRYIPKPPNPEILKRHGQSQRDTVEENWEEEERAEFEHDPEADNDEDEDDENDEADYEEDEATTNSREYKRKLFLP